MYALVGTHTHPVYSEDRCGYVGLGDLEVGERVRTAEGWATVEAMARWWGQATVHNLEVEAQHRFLAGAAGVVSHNAGGGGGRGSGGSCFGESCGGPGSRPNVDTKKSRRVTHELEPGDRRTPAENAEARQYYENHKDKAKQWWSERNGNKPWPEGEFGEHPRSIKEGGDPLYIEPGGFDPAAAHMVPRPPDGLTDFQRWGSEGGRRRNPR